MIKQDTLQIQANKSATAPTPHNQAGSIRKSALDILEATSRTFFIPISRLPAGLLEAVGSGYLCMRAIDEIEDHPDLDAHSKVKLLRVISQSLQSAVDGLKWETLEATLISYKNVIPEVTLRLCEWLQLSPDSIAPRIWDATATMADRMADWVEANWIVRSQADLDRYTFSVAGTVGLMLSDLWGWFDGTRTDRINAIGFGRGLQAVNILRNRAEDLTKGVDFFPKGWGEAEMHAYARRNLDYGDAYVQELPLGPAMDFCKIPLILAHATIDALAEGRSKLSRTEVMRLVAE
ncbi:squalene/phytoene synthase family protein [Chloroflexota bacterium]